MFTKVGRLPENGEVKCDLDMVTYITSSLAKALWIYTFRASVPGLGASFDWLCSEFLKSAFVFMVFPIGTPWSIEDGFVFYPLRDLVTTRSFLKGSEAPRSNRILDCLLTVACCGETLTPVNSPAIANLCGIWVKSIWSTQGQTDALQFANTVVRRILRPLFETENRDEDVPVALAIWLRDGSTRRTNNSRSSTVPNLHDDVRLISYKLNPSTHLQRFIKVLSRCSVPTSKKLIWDNFYQLPLDYCCGGRMPTMVFHWLPAYHFIYSNEENPGLRHLLYLFQGEAIHDLERVISQYREAKGIENDGENGESIPPSPTSSIEESEVDLSLNPFKQETPESHYLLDFRFKPPFPQFGIKGDPDVINCGIRAPAIPRDDIPATPSSNNSQQESDIVFYVIA
jgi:hypothetical protein